MRLSKAPKRYPTLQDQNQSFWQMASIQSAAFGISALSFGSLLGVKFGPGTALISIFVGNILLWLVGLAVVGMTSHARTNAIQNFSTYIGRYGSWIGGFALSLAILFWYPLQIKNTVSGIHQTLQSHISLSDSFDLRAGVFFGIFTSILVIGGIKTIKWFNTISFPLLLLFIVYAILKNESIPTLAGTWGISMSATLMVISATLAGIINLPTFFRHRKTEVDSFSALSLFVVFTIVIESLAIFLTNAESGQFFVQYMSSHIGDAILVVIFSILALACVNIVNIYFASAVWEILFPWASKSRELSIIGIGGTLMFVFIQSEYWMLFFESLFTNYIGVLGIVLIAAFAIKKIVGHRQRKFEIFLSLLSWFGGAAVATAFQIQHPDKSVLALSYGIGLSALFTVGVLFIEESAWSLQRIYLKAK